jgi:hypothetical protein
LNSTCRSITQQKETGHGHTEQEEEKEEEDEVVNGRRDLASGSRAAGNS